MSPTSSLNGFLSTVLILIGVWLLWGTGWALLITGLDMSVHVLVMNALALLASAHVQAHRRCPVHDKEDKDGETV